jgi:hypothetical protein
MGGILEMDGDQLVEAFTGVCLIAFAKMFHPMRKHTFWKMKRRG